MSPMKSRKAATVIWQGKKENSHINNSVSQPYSLWPLYVTKLTCKSDSWNIVRISFVVGQKP